jgi:hypothetical protein
MIVPRLIDLWLGHQNAEYQQSFLALIEKYGGVNERESGRFPACALLEVIALVARLLLTCMSRNARFVWHGHRQASSRCTLAEFAQQGAHCTQLPLGCVHLDSA